MDGIKVKISIIYPSFNDHQIIQKNLSSIKKLSNLSEIELVIIDNNSTDSTKEVIISFKNHININLIELESNVGFAKACNIGAMRSKGEFLFFTNQDMVFPFNFFEKLLALNERLEKNNEIIICPAIVFRDGESINYFGAKIHFLGFSYDPDMNKKIPEKIDTFKTLKASGGSMFLRKDTFIKLNGFDSYFFMYHEDTDFSLKAIRNNIMIYTTNEIKSIHLKYDFTLSDFTYYYIERNRFMVIAKNLDNIKNLIPFFIISELILLIQAILTNKLKTRFKVYKFLIQNYQNIKNKRKHSSNNRVHKLKRYHLSSHLDPILLGDMQQNFILKYLLKVVNLFL